MTVNVTEDFPAGTVKLAVTVAAGWLLESFKTTPPVGALPVSVTNPVDEAPPVTVEGLRLTDWTVGERTFRVDVCETEL